LAAADCIPEFIFVGVFGTLIAMCGEIFLDLAWRCVCVEAKFPISALAITALVRHLLAYIQAAVPLEVYHDRRCVVV
jgi:hypothetical protein